MARPSTSPTRQAPWPSSSNNRYWSKEKVKSILNALALTEEGVGLTQEELRDLSTRQVRSITEEARRVQRETNDLELARNLAPGAARALRPAEEMSDIRGGEWMVEALDKVRKAEYARLSSKDRHQIPEQCDRVHGREQLTQKRHIAGDANTEDRRAAVAARLSKFLA